MDEEVYDDLKEAFLQKLNISPETYHQRFRSTTFQAVVANRDLPPAKEYVQALGATGGAL